MTGHSQKNNNEQNLLNLQVNVAQCIQLFFHFSHYESKRKSTKRPPVYGFHLLTIPVEKPVSSYIQQNLIPKLHCSCDYRLTPRTNDQRCINIMHSLKNDIISCSDIRCKENHELFTALKYEAIKSSGYTEVALDKEFDKDPIGTIIELAEHLGLHVKLSNEKQILDEIERSFSSKGLLKIINNLSPYCKLFTHLKFNAIENSDYAEEALDEMFDKDPIGTIIKLAKYLALQVKSSNGKQILDEIERILSSEDLLETTDNPNLGYKVLQVKRSKVKYNKEQILYEIEKSLLSKGLLGTTNTPNLGCYLRTKTYYPHLTSSHLFDLVRIKNTSSKVERSVIPQEQNAMVFVEIQKRTSHSNLTYLSADIIELLQPTLPLNYKSNFVHYGENLSKKELYSIKLEIESFLSRSFTCISECNGFEEKIKGHILELFNIFLGLNIVSSSNSTSAHSPNSKYHKAYSELMKSLREIIELKKEEVLSQEAITVQEIAQKLGIIANNSRIYALTKQKCQERLGKLSLHEILPEINYKKLSIESFAELIKTGQEKKCMTSHESEIFSKSINHLKSNIETCKLDNEALLEKLSELQSYRTVLSDVTPESNLARRLSATKSLREELIRAISCGIKSKVPEKAGGCKSFNELDSLNLEGLFNKLNSEISKRLSELEKLVSEIKKDLSTMEELKNELYGQFPSGTDSSMQSKIDNLRLSIKRNLLKKDEEETCLHASLLKITNSDVLYKAYNQFLTKLQIRRNLQKQSPNITSEMLLHIFCHDIEVIKRKPGEYREISNRITLPQHRLSEQTQRCIDQFVLYIMLIFDQIPENHKSAESLIQHLCHGCSYDDNSSKNLIQKIKTELTKKATLLKKEPIFNSKVSLSGNIDAIPEMNSDKQSVDNNEDKKILLENFSTKFKELFDNEQSSSMASSSTIDAEDGYELIKISECSELKTLEIGIEEKITNLSNLIDSSKQISQANLAKTEVAKPESEESPRAGKIRADLEDETPETEITDALTEPQWLSPGYVIS